jgi:adenine-specific DNA methylase
VDPIAGGGSIPLEALRLGCDAFASDLNPVACLILKVMLEDIPATAPRSPRSCAAPAGTSRRRRRRS